MYNVLNTDPDSTVHVHFTGLRAHNKANDSVSLKSIKSDRHARHDRLILLVELIKISIMK